MRPRKLHIQGFTCFAEPVEIDFSDMDVFVISGPTGAGKSTIIDAICYALYGRVSRHNETQGLVSHNRDSLRVAFEFSAAAQIYRVIRTINLVRKTGPDGQERVTRSQSPVQLEQLIDDIWNPMEGRVRKIDDEIARIVGLDFVAFQRCVVLPQGRFQEFLAGEKSSRQDVLKDLLDIGIYEQIMRSANSLASERGNAAANTERRLTEDYADATTEELQVCSAQLAEVIPELENARRRRSALTDAGTLAEVVVGARSRARQRSDDLGRTEKEIETLKRFATQSQERLHNLREKVGTTDSDLGKVMYDGPLHRALDVALEQARRLEAARGDLAKAQDVANDDRAIKQAAAMLEQAAAVLKQIDARRALAASRLDDARRGDAAAHVRSGLKHGDPCPVCGGVVGKSKKILTTDVKAAEKVLREAEVAARKAEQAHQDAELGLRTSRQETGMLKKRVEDIAHVIATSDAELKKALPSSVPPKIDAIQAALDEQSAASNQLERLRDLLAKLRAELAELEPKVAESDRRIVEATTKASLLHNEVVTAMKEGDDAIAKLRELATAATLKNVLELIAAKKDPRPAVSDALASASRAYDELTKTKTQLETRTHDLEARIARAAELRDELKVLREEGALYKELATLLRADHFQEFVIRSAMRVLAESATEHLKSLYPRFAMHVESGEFEVIDHWQADRTRSAKTLSGGETFIASLALALALSERLPELRSNASARIESLFLDEGFGTLDVESLEAVINALEGLRSEDRMVGVITHVPELAQRIDRRITVLKSRSGSRIDLGTP